MKILTVHSALNRPESISRSVANQLVQRLTEKYPESSIVIRDLITETPEHWGEAQVQAAFVPKDKRSLLHEQALLKSDQYCNEILSSTHLIISSPMWNFSIPSVLKAWIDHIVRVGVTFSYGPQGPVGLAKNLEKVFIVESMGGLYQNETAHLNHVGPYIESVLKFIGAQEVALITAQGTAIDRDRARRRAASQIHFATN